MKKTINNFDVFKEGDASGVIYKNRTQKKAMIRYIDQHGLSTITEMSQDLKASVPKMTSLINELIIAGLIQDQGKLDSTGGRRASVYGLVSGACFFLGVDVKQYHINFGLMDFNRNMVIEKQKVPFLLENDPECLQRLIVNIEDFILSTGVQRQLILGMGINLKGRINLKAGHNFNYFHFHDEPLTATIQKETGIPAFLENDSRAMALGEYYNRVDANEKHIVFVNLDYGIGTGIIIDGNLYIGKSGFSGEISHIPLFENELLCHCGKKGCLETEASGYAVLRKFKERIKKGASSSILKDNRNPDEVTLADIVSGAQAEDTLCIELLAEAGEKLGKGLAVLINIFNPELMIIGGVMAESGDYIHLPAKSTLNKLSLGLVNNDTLLKFSSMGERAGVVGGCLNARNKVIG
jgi:predicted NBD/HSP70 family sugar kinase